MIANVKEKCFSIEINLYAIAEMVQGSVFQVETSLH